MRNGKQPAVIGAGLHLNLHRQYFDAIAGGTKKTEYRTRTPYWRTRLEGRRYNLIKFRNGYATRAPEMLVEFAGLRRHGRGANALYAIRLGRIRKLTRWRSQFPSLPRATAAAFFSAHFPLGVVKGPTVRPDHFNKLTWPTNSFLPSPLAPRAFTLLCRLCGMVM